MARDHRRGRNTIDTEERDRGIEPTESGASPDRCALSGGAGRTYQAVGGILFVVLILLGAATLYVAIRTAPWNWAAAVAFCVYAPVAGLLFATRGCGHSMRGKDAAQADDGGGRAAAFLINLPILLPAWLAPPAVAGIALYREFSWVVAVIGVAFAIEAFVALPLVARLYICTRCPRRRACPWMRSAH